MAILHTSQHHELWNKGKLIGQKAPFKLKDIWAIRIRPQLGHKVRDLALFNLAIDSKLRACDLVKLRVSDVSHGGQMASRAIVMQQKTGRPVQFEITQSTRETVQAWITLADLMTSDCLFTSRVTKSPHLSTRQYAMIVHRWSRRPGLRPSPMAPTRCEAPKHR
jgi:site-specific recombinase XerC